MDAAAWHQLADTTLWRVTGYGRLQRVAPGVDYSWDNTHRQPAGTCVIQLTLAGSCDLLDADGIRHHVGPGQAMLFANGEPTRYGSPRERGEAYVCRWITLAGAGLHGHWSMLRARRGPLVPMPAGDPLRGELERLGEMSAGTDGGDPAAMAAAVHRFVMLLHRRVDEGVAAEGGAVEAAIGALLRNPRAALSLKEVAERHGVSREHLARAFRARMGEPPGRWLARARLRHAIDLLRGTSLSVREIATQSGIGSAHALARQVRAATGGSPRSLREGPDQKK